MPTILVVDDEPAIRLLLRLTLEEAGYRVIEAADGAAALQATRQQRPDLVLLDVALPGLSGIEVCRRLRAEPATAATPVLLISGIDRRIEAEAAAAGALACIVKPFELSGLVEQAARALRRAPIAVS